MAVSAKAETAGGWLTCGVTGREEAVSLISSIRGSRVAEDTAGEEVDGGAGERGLYNAGVGTWRGRGTAGLRPGYVFLGTWAVSTAGLGWLAWGGQHAFDSPATIPALLTLLVCTAALLWWLATPVPDLPGRDGPTRRGRFVLLVALAVIGLFSLRTLVGPPLLFALPVLSLVVLVVLAVARPPVHWQEVWYAVALALIAGVAGLAAGWVSFPPLAWAGLQVALVLPGLLAGWGVLRRAGLLEARLGHSLLMMDGPVAALRGFVQGMMIATPWALGALVLGAASGEAWVARWWHPLVAIQPGIAEEAWGRVLLVPLLFLAFRPVARSRAALTAAVVVLAYWFAYLHTPGGIQGLISTAMIGTLFALPTSYVWLRRGLEAAIGFHFWLDFVKFLAAYVLNRGLWPG